MDNYKEERLEKLSKNEKEIILLNELLNDFPDSEILSLGKNYAKKGDYEKAITIFKKGSKNCGTLGKICGIYTTITLGVLVNPKIEHNEYVKIPDCFLKKVMHNVFWSLLRLKEIYDQGELSKEDLLDLESLVDKININNTNLSKENKSPYNKFKEYLARFYSDK